LLELLSKSFELISSFDPDLYEIIFLSLKVSFIALLISSIIGLPICAIIATNNFIGKKVLIIFFNSMMALPPVFVGLVLYILFSKSGPLGFLEILYTPSIMIIAQIVLILPIIISVGIETLENIAKEYDELLSILNVTLKNKIKIILWDGRFVLFTCILTGLGRALSEVGAIIIVGGNIIHVTRVMTTSIALETSKGNLTLAMSLGIILIIISIILNGFALVTKYSAKRFSYD
jgi:tungstate transport system permease protein